MTKLSPRFKMAIAYFAGVLSMPLAILLVALSGLAPVAGTASPPAWEEAIGRTALHNALARRAGEDKNPLSPGDDVLRAGMRLFRNNCAGCHGDGRDPSPWGSKNFYPRVPQFGQSAPDLSAEEIYVAVRYGVRYSGMGAWDGLMKEEDMWKVATFLDRLDALPPAVNQAWRAPTQ